MGCFLPNNPLELNILSSKIAVIHIVYSQMQINSSTYNLYTIVIIKEVGRVSYNHKCNQLKPILLLLALRDLCFYNAEGFEQPLQPRMLCGVHVRCMYLAHCEHSLTYGSAAKHQRPIWHISAGLIWPVYMIVPILNVNSTSGYEQMAWSCSAHRWPNAGTTQHMLAIP